MMLSRLVLTLLVFLVGEESGSRSNNVYASENYVPSLSSRGGRASSFTRGLSEQTVVNPYLLWEPRKIKETLYDWVNYYPNFVRLTSAQDAYGLPAAGGAQDCPFDDGDGCRNYILTIQDFAAHPEGSPSSKRLPEVFLSGELHGNERVGPTAVMEAAHLLLEAATCEAKPRHFAADSSQHSFNDKNTDWDSQMKAAKQCRKDLEQTGMDDLHRRWLARLVSTRRIVIVPTANALGYFRNVREEGKNDPNRDFPYDVEEKEDCMKTIAGRTLNEIFREHMFQLSLTFHGGMEVVGYEWGAPTWLGHLSPDDEAQKSIGRAYSQYGGGFGKTKPYKYGTMNDLVYYVRGGFEDWAYAGSWDPDRVIACDPQTFGGYDTKKSIYNNSTLRVFNMLVETSDKKEPTPDTLGTSLNVFESNTTGNGHVSRNIRLSLLAADLVQPYVSVVGINDLTLTDDLVPLATREDRTCQETKTVMVPENKDDASIRWTVGGAMEVDSTELWYAKWDDVPEDVLNCMDQPSKKSLKNFFKAGTVIGPSDGTGFFSKHGSSPLAQTPSDFHKAAESMGPVFQGSIDLSQGFEKHDKIVVIASARVDQSWTNQPVKMKPNVAPQSHVVNARTNPTWHHESAGKIIDGRLDWFSMPLTLVVGDYEDSVGSQGVHEVGTVELSNRFGETTGDIHGGITPSSGATGTNGESHLSFFNILFMTAIAVGCVMAVKRFAKSRRSPSFPDTPPEYLDDDDEGEYGLGGTSRYTDKAESVSNANEGVELNKIT